MEAIMKHKELRNLVVGLVFGFSSLSVLAAVLPHSFAPNTPIKSAEVNANFASLNNTKQERITGTCAAGSSIREVLADGAVTCELDDSSAGGGLTSVTANPAYLVGDGTASSPLGLKFGLAVEGAAAGGAFYLGNTDGGFGLHGANVRIDGGVQPGVKGSSKSTSAGATGVLGLLDTNTVGNDAAGVRGVDAGTNETSSGVKGESNTGAGVRGVGKNKGGIGVVAATDDPNGTALLVDGKIAVPNTRDNRAAFVHRATEKSVCTKLTPITDENAVVVATHNFNKSGNGGLHFTDPFEAVYGDGVWNICTANLAIIQNQAFNVIVIHVKPVL
jgi:hypothetical protein